jgi:biotin carboxyl carrier protein
MSPFATAVAGAGIVEASSENIAIGAAVPGIVTKIAVKWGDRVQSGDVLFTIDDRDVQGQLLIAAAKVREAGATLAKAHNLLEVGEGLTRGSSISAVDLANRRYDVGIDEALLASANAQVDQLKFEAERRVVRAPLAGRILQIKVPSRRIRTGWRRHSTADAAGRRHAPACPCRHQRERRVAGETHGRRSCLRARQSGTEGAHCGSSGSSPMPFRRRHSPARAPSAPTRACCR